LVIFIGITTEVDKEPYYYKVFFLFIF